MNACSSRWLVATVLVTGGVGLLVPLAAHQQRQEEPPRLILVTEEHIRPAYAQAFEQYRKERNAHIVKNKREFPFTVMTTRDADLAYVFKTAGLRDLGDYEKWSRANVAASGGVTTPKGPEPIDSQEMYYIRERPEWSYEPASPRVPAAEARFIHWDVFYGSATPTLWGMTAPEAAAAGYLSNADFYKQLVALYRDRNIRDGFTVYTSYALSIPEGNAVFVETRARDAKDYYTQLLQTQGLLGADGLALLVKRLGSSRQVVRRDFDLRPDLSYAGPTS